MEKSSNFEVTIPDERKERAIAMLVEGMSPAAVADELGYPGTSIYYLLNHTDLGVEVARRLGQRIVMEGAPAALAFLIRLVHDEKAADRARADAAKTLLDRAGFVAPKAADPAKPGDKGLADMSKDDLRDLIERGQKELANRASPIIDVPVSETTPSDNTDLLD